MHRRGAEAEAEAMQALVLCRLGVDERRETRDTWATAEEKRKVDGSIRHSPFAAEPTRNSRQPLRPVARLAGLQACSCRMRQKGQVGRLEPCPSRGPVALYPNPMADGTVSRPLPVDLSAPPTGGNVIRHAAAPVTALPQGQALYFACFVSTRFPHISRGCSEKIKGHLSDYSIIKLPTYLSMQT